MLAAYPTMRIRDRGNLAGLKEIVFSEDQSWEDARAFASKVIAEHRMTLVRRCDGPNCWLWDVHWNGGEFIFGYDDFPCETVLISSNDQHQDALVRLFEAIQRGELKC